MSIKEELIGAELVNQNTDEEAQSINQNVDEEAGKLLALLGATGNTGGSAATGTVMGKLNKIISDIAAFVANWTSTRAGHIDTINTNAKTAVTKATAAATDAAAGKANTTTNNTASKTGILSQKASYLISLLENTTYGLNALKNAIAANGNATAQTKAFTTIASGTVDGGKSVTITGKGVLYVIGGYSYTTGANYSLNVDGKGKKAISFSTGGNVASDRALSVSPPIYFESSVVLYNDEVAGCEVEYFVQT